MKQSILAIVVSLLLASGALAQPTCTSQASEKNLKGAALNSFMKKCESDAKTACTKSSQEKKLKGAAKTSFEKKCVEDATGKQ
jgi:hypothetical protein